ncbi:MAG TPA: M50 family metallopeptidase [Candidatus Saccharimonadales bacterium]|nr:M50 family metallopeptidase [Candidatus Saccharimonadales bacterium]
MLITLLVFLAIIALLVFVHELGHFLVAKWNGVVVEEFAFGFKPRIWGKKIGETFYAINAVPLGGYVKMLGEGDDAAGPGSFKSKTIFQRFQVMVAGAVMNLLLGWVLLTILFWVGFQPLFPGVAKDPFVHQTSTVLVTGVSAGSPAQTAGLKAGDQIVAINGEKSATAQEFIASVGSFLGQPVNLTVKENNVAKTVVVTPRVHPPAGQGAIGVALTSSGNVKAGLLAAPAAAIYETGRIIGLSVAGFGHFVATLVAHQRVSQDVTGLVGVGVLTGVARRLGLTYLAQLVVMITIGLGVINLLPILPLDGGQIVALGYEKAAGRPLNEKQLNALVAIGLGIVLLLFVVVTYKDIVRFNIFQRI